MRPGQVERREFEYVRHGTQALIAHLDVATGKVGGSVADTRTEADFAAFLEALFASAAPTMRWRIVCDNLDTHMSEAVVRLVARPHIEHRRLVAPSNTPATRYRLLAGGGQGQQRRRTRTTNSTAVISVPSGGSGRCSIPMSSIRSISCPSPSTKK